MIWNLCFANSSQASEPSYFQSDTIDIELWRDKSGEKLSALELFVKDHKNAIENIKKEYEIQKEAISAEPINEKSASELLRQAAESVQDRLQQIEKMITYRKKCRDAGLDERVATYDPECAAFIFDTGSIFHMQAHENSFGTPVVQIENGTPHMLVEGKLMSWDSIKEMLVYDKKQWTYVSKNNLEERWNYLSPDGFVKKDRLVYDALYPVGVLQENERKALVEFANTHGEDHKDAVIQIFTSKYRSSLSRNWLTENYIDEYPYHVGLRLVDNKGQVYSFGLEIESEGFEKLHNDPFSTFMTTDAHISASDFDERKKFISRTVTTLPLSQEKVDELLCYVRDVNKAGLRYNLFKQNCTGFAAAVMDKAGYPIHTRIKFFTGLGKIMPTFSKIPYIGAPLSSLASSIKNAVAPIFSTLALYTPACVSSAISWVSSAGKTAIEKISNVCANLFFIVFGALRATPFNDKEDDDIDKMPISRFSRMLRSPYDLFADPVLHFSGEVEKWQREYAQKTTKEYAYTTPQFYGLRQLI